MRADRTGRAPVEQTAGGIVADFDDIARPPAPRDALGATHGKSDPRR